MMATDDEIRPDVRMLPRLIEVAEESGRWEHAQKLRDWLAEAQQKEADESVSDVDELTEADYQNAEPDETIITTSLDCFPRDIRFRLYDREVTDPSQLTKWRPRFLTAIGLSAEQIRVVNRFNDAIGFTVGSDVELLAEVPPKSPFGIDLRDGRTAEDCLSILRRMARGELTFRDASVELGSRGLSKVRPHQRACSLVIRHSRAYANEFRMAILEKHHDEGWLIDAGLKEFPGAKPGWGLWLKVAESENRVKQILDAVPKPVYGGMASRGCPIILIGGGK